MRQRSTSWFAATGLIIAVVVFASSGLRAGRAALDKADPGKANGAARPEAVVWVESNPAPGNPNTKQPDVRDVGAPGVFDPLQRVRVKRIAIAYGASGEAFVDVAMSDPASYHVMSLKNPPRLAVDIEPARTENVRRVYPAESPLLKDARVGQFNDSTVRVVADLSGQPVPAVYPEPGGLRIALRPAAAGGANLEPEIRGSGKPAVTVQTIPPQGKVPAHPNFESRAPDRTAAAKSTPLNTQAESPDLKASSHTPVPDVPAHKPNAPTLKKDRLGDSAVKGDGWRAGPPAPARAGSERAGGSGIVAVALAPNADAPWLPRTITPLKPGAPRGVLGSAGSSAMEGPVREVKSADEAARVLADRVVALDARGPLSIAVPGGSPPGAAKPTYTGERISVNLKDVDLTDFFRLIHEVSGLNVIVDSNVSGKVTLVLDSVPWDQALDIVLRNNGLGRSLDGNVLRIGRIATLEQEEDAAAKLEETRVEAGPLMTVIRPLKYARALDTAAAQSTIPGMPPATSTPGLVTILKNLNGVLSKRGDIVADARSNSLIITDVAPQIPVIESLVDKLDTRPKQISIEARIVQANSDFVRTLTSALNGGTVNASGSTATGGTTGTGASAQGNIPTATGAGGTTASLITLGQTAATGFGAYAIVNQSARYFISAAIAAAETRDQLKLISSPTIITQNNVAGKVAQGVEVPYQTTINNTISTQFKDATLELDVTPQVTHDGSVFLLLYVQDDTVGAVVPGLGVSINHQSATTQVLVPDGGTVMFGGIKLSRQAKTVTQVPGLGSIPLFGNLFKSSEVDRTDQELIFFVTPKVIPG